MDNQLIEYTFTFNCDDESLFRRIQNRLDDNEYVTVKPIESVDPENRYSDKTATMQMPAEAAMMFRLGMKNVKIRRLRSEEELAAEEAEAAKNRITIKVHVGNDQSEHE